MRIRLLLLAGLCALLIPGTKPRGQSAGITFTAGDHDLSIVAHEDDDLLFINPDIQTRIQTGDKVRTVYLTAGDAGLGTAYWQDREAGIHAAHAQMAGVANAWTASDLALADKTVHVDTLNAAPNVSVAFLRLPDGGPNGVGYTVTGSQSLQFLWDGTIARIDSLDGANNYTKDELIRTLTCLLMDFGAQHVQTQDASNLYGVDHFDHRFGARFAFEAHQLYAASGAAHTFNTYRGYNIVNEAANLMQTQYDVKWATFLTYAQFDSQICAPGTTCVPSASYSDYTWRQYAIAQSAGLAGLVGVFSGECLTAGTDLADGTAPAIISACPASAAPSQTWTINADGSVVGSESRCLEVSGGTAAAGTPTQLAACSGAAAQRWTAFENGQIRGPAGMCLDVTGGSTTGGTPVQISDCAALLEQQWALPPPQSTSSPDFAIGLSAGASFQATVKAGQSATYNLVLLPNGLTGNVSLQCSGVPQGAACSFSPATVTLSGQNPSSVTLSVATAANAGGTLRLFFQALKGNRMGGLAAFYLALLCALAAFIFFGSRRVRLTLAMLLLVLLSACTATFTPSGGGAGSDTPAGTYPLTIVANSGNVFRSLTIVLKVQ